MPQQALKARPEQKQAAKKFSEYWKGKGYEKGQSQPFWMSLLGDVLGAEHPEQVIEFEEQVKMEHTSFIDAYIPSTKVLIEQKSLGKNLDAPIKQSDGSLLTPFQQAKRYVTELPLSKHPRWIVTSNFAEFRVYDMERPNAPAEVILLADLEKEAHRLQFLVDQRSEHMRKEMEVSLEAGGIVGRIYDTLKDQYEDPDSMHSQHSLNVLCVRLVFCLYAESAGIFGGHDMFGAYLRAHKDNARDALLKLFRVLDQKEGDRDQYDWDDVLEFPYVNGGLFREQIEIPKLTPEILDLILHKASEGFDWADISPTIFGAIFESTLNAETRRAGGMHYTSVENIHKVIDPLFLDDLRSELDEILHKYKSSKGRRAHLDAFRSKLGSLTFLDPACGSGNFLTETYLSLRRLENEAVRALTKGQIGWEITNPIQVSIEQFYGIEINDFACTVAQTALWIAEAQMLQETESILNMQIEYLPLTTAAHIVEGNALRMDWEDVISAHSVSYLISNPPFCGYAYQTPLQKSDLRLVLGDDRRNVDYVSGWFWKAARYMQGTYIRAAFVSTNSITMGEQVAATWEPLLACGIHIDFAWTTFKWTSEAASRAQVHVVIVGFSVAFTSEKPRLFSGSGFTQVENISPYLMPGKMQFVGRRNTPLCAVPALVRGSQPTDDGNLILTEAEKDELLKVEPQAEQFLRPFMMGKDFINRKPRWCLWLVDADPSQLKKCPHVLKRVEAVREFRQASKKTATRKKADTPTLFDEVKECKAEYIAVPVVSSENRRYIPMDYIDKEVIAGNKLFQMEGATLYHFGVLASNVHMAWMRTVTGRMKSDYSYSNTIVYNNFPWPDPTPAQKAKIEQTAQAILDARALYPNASLADLYDEATMPPELRKAHQENDKAVMAAYGLPVKGTSEANAVAHLMKMHQKLTAEEG